jgi:hypothetical protein
MNFKSQDDAERYLAIQLMSYLVNDVEVHDAVNDMTDFSFLLSDLANVFEYDQLYQQEHTMCMSILKIFGEMSKTPRSVE